MNDGVHMRDEIKEEVEQQLRERDRKRRKRNIAYALLTLFVASAAGAANFGGEHQASDLFRRFFTWSGNDITLANNGTLTVTGSASSTFNPNVDANFTYMQGSPLRVSGAAATFAVYADTGGFASGAGSGTNAFGVITNGARIDFGGGANDYASSDGTTVTFSAPVAATTFINGASGGAYKNTNMFIQNTAPTISSGFGSGASVASNNGTVGFRIGVGTGGVATSGVIGLPAASNGWVCNCAALTPGANITRMTATSSTSCTVSNVAMSTGAAAAWTASDVLECTAIAR